MFHSVIGEEFYKIEYFSKQASVYSQKSRLNSNPLYGPLRVAPRPRYRVVAYPTAPWFASVDCSIGNKTGTIGTRNEFDCSVIVEVDPVSAHAEWSGMPFESIWILWAYQGYSNQRPDGPVTRVKYPDLKASMKPRTFDHFCNKAIDDCNDIHPNCFRLK